ncbi:MAG: nucleotide sugar dehydrogenase [Gammaproteobacteria bacterium]|nr:MAG: nucleotide sugar dehydrogenase [Gammaproteobacteria bacterium]
MSTVAIVGLGYVGLPLALEFGKKQKTIGFDINDKKIGLYRQHIDLVAGASAEEMQAATHIEYSSDPAILKNADYLIVAVPTPIDEARQPDFTPLIRTSTTVGQNMKKGCTVIYESTVYPGATEDICVPILEKESGLKWKKDFHVGYSPERINPGDKEHTVATIVKVVSGDDDTTLEKIAKLYETVITAGVHRASCIKTAEAAKVIENTQRDLNIALMNELAIIFDMIGIDTLEVLEAAGSKWNFLPFRPGLVGGHCISVDPYYLTHKAEMMGYHPQVVLAGRRINDSMGKFVAQQTVKHMIAANSHVKGSKVNIIGLTFKENCPDLRNSRVKDVIDELEDFGVEVHLYDPVALLDELKREYGDRICSWDDLPEADALIVAVLHEAVLDMDNEVLASKIKKGGCFIDVKSRFDQKALEGLGLSVWRL